MTVEEASDAALIADLRRRLDEAEETLRAIRDGEVDALVVRGLREDEVFTLQGGTESYRAFMETMDPGAAALDAAGRVLYANNALCSLLGTTLSELQGRPLLDAFDDGARAGIEGVVRAAEASTQSAEIRVNGRAGEVILLVSATPLAVGLMSGRAVTFTDMTERVRAAAAEESERAARAIIASANEAVIVCDLDGIITHVNLAASVIHEGDPVGRRFADAVPLVFPGATGLLDGNELVQLAIAGQSMQGIEAVAPDAPKVKDYLVSAGPLRVADDKVSGCVVTMVDLSQRKAAEKQQLLLMAELDHRVKNTLALVLSISSRTLSSEDTLVGFQSAFTGRIQALAATHTLLAEKSWRDLSIADVVLAELAPYVGSNAGRVALEGVDIAVTPRAAIALGLIFHELATNAAKYGALSNEVGHVTVRLGNTTSEESLGLEWLESGGPAVSQPTRKGFGRTVIARSLQYSPGGGADMDFRPDGMFCAIRVPREDVPQPEA